jgi:hypothetical protein
VDFGAELYDEQHRLGKIGNSTIKITIIITITITITITTIITTAIIIVIITIIIVPSQVSSLLSIYNQLGGFKPTPLHLPCYNRVMMQNSHRKTIATLL